MIAAFLILLAWAICLFLAFLPATDEQRTLAARLPPHGVGSTGFRAHAQAIIDRRIWKPD